MRHADAGGHGHGRMGHGDVLDVDGADPLAAGLDHVLAAVGDLHEAVRVDGGHVTRGEPAAALRILDQRALALEVAVHDPGAAHQQVAIALAVPGLVGAVAVDDAHVHAIDGEALLLQDLHLLVLGQLQLLVLERAQRAQRAHLGHAPGMQHLHAELVLEGRDHGRWAGGAADHRALERGKPQAARPDVAQQHLPDRGHAGRVGDAFGLDQLVQRLAVQRGAREHQLAARERGRVGNAPGVDVEHGHYGQHRVARRYAHHIGQRGRVGVQRGGAVAVEHRLRVARGAAGVAHAGGRVLVEFGPLVLVGLAANPVLVADQARNAAVGGQAVRIAQRHPLAHRGALGMHGLDDGQEGQVKAHDAVFRVVDDPRHLVGVQARVDRVQHAARAADAEVHLHVAVAVPGQRGHAVAGLQAQAVQRVRQLARTPCQVAVRIAMDIALHPARDDLRIAMVAVGEVDQRRDQQWLALHQTQHL